MAFFVFVKMGKAQLSRTLREIKQLLCVQSLIFYDIKQIVLCDLLLDRCTATWNLFVLYNKELNFARIKAVFT